MEDASAVGGVLVAIVILVYASSILLRYLPGRLSLPRNAAELALRMFAFPFRTVWALFVSHQNRETNLPRGQMVIHNPAITPLQFLALVENTILVRAIPDAHVTYVLRREGGLLSARRNYLRITRTFCVGLVGVVPLGTALLVTWRIGQRPALETLAQFSSITVLAELLLRPPTLYRQDALIAFQRVIQASIFEVREQLQGQAIRAGYAGGDAPMLRDFYR